MNKTDLNHIWHPYTSILNPTYKYKIKSANGVYLTLDNDKQIIDGMSSWWSTIHGYNHPKLNKAISNQLESMSHVMFGGLTHEPAIKLAQNLLNILDDSFEHIFFCDSGSVSVEVAMKMALQYNYQNNKTKKTKFLTVQKGYHGDTFGAMSVCDPITGMHSIFNDVLHQNIFVKAPNLKTNNAFDINEMDEIKEVFEKRHHEIAAVIIEPIVQGAGGMRIYYKEYLQELRKLCDKYDVLLIFDEIATGFGRTGKLFAYEHAKVTPDIITLGKALTGGYMTMAATITTSKVAKGIEQHGNILMHGPTFMANPLACSVANASIELLFESNWQENVSRIESYLKNNLSRCYSSKLVNDIRVIGAIGVIELNSEIDMEKATKLFIKNDIWVRPFGKLVYIMPPYIITNKQLEVLIVGIQKTLESL